jgi:sensor histidine kinase YesM
LRGRPAPFTMTTAERWGLLFMGVGTVIFTSVYLLNILYTANSRFIQYFGGFGGIIVIVLMGLTVFYFYSVWKFSVKIRAMQRANRVQGRQRFQQPGSANPEASARAAAV